jgi:hypothetical protein
MSKDINELHHFVDQDGKPITVKFIGAPGDPVLPASKYCAALRSWAELASHKRSNGLTEVSIITEEEVSHLELAITKSCLLKRMIYMEELEPRKRQCPIHLGRWSGCSFERCPAGCDTCGCLCGWLPDDLECSPEWGWTFWLAHAIDPQDRLPGIPPASWYNKTKEAP